MQSAFLARSKLLSASLGFLTNSTVNLLPRSLLECKRFLHVTPQNLKGKEKQKQKETPKAPSSSTAAAAASSTSPASPALELSTPENNEYITHTHKGDPTYFERPYEISMQATEFHDTLDNYTRRTGLIGVKLGMMHTWDKWGNLLPLTIIQIQNAQVISSKVPETHGYTAVQVAAVPFKSLHRMRHSQRKFFENLRLRPKKHIKEFRVTPNAVLPIGTPLYAAHFVPGQHVDIVGTTVGKGFQGSMKRHGMRGKFATHGVSLVHRAMGSFGGGGGMGRVYPRKRMPGHMGTTKTIHRNLLVYRINNKHNLLYVKGNLPGKPNSLVFITDALRKPPTFPIPFPTFLPRPDAAIPIEFSNPPSQTEDPNASL